MKVERNDVYMIGIYGISGIGKTGLLELQKKLLWDTLKDQSLTIRDHGQGINVIK